MRVIPVNTQAALEADTLVTRDFMRITGRVRATGAPISEGFWSDVGEVTAQVIDVDTGLAVSYLFSPAGSLIAIDPIPMLSNLTVQEIGAEFSQLDDRINDLIKTYDISQGKVEIWRAEYDPATMVMVAPAASLFIGTIDGAPIETPAEGGVGSVALKFISPAQELTRNNPDLRSHESQQDRAPGDDFYKDVTAVGDLVIFWGRAGSMRNEGSGA